MTIIVGIADKDKIFIGGDRGASDGSSIVSIKSSKVGRNGDIIYGYSGTIGIGQLIGLIDLPPLGDMNPYLYIRLTVVEELRKSIESYSREKDDLDTTWLIGCQGHLYEVSQEDWSVVEVHETAVGSGGNFSLGSLYTTSLSLFHDPYRRIQLALDAAITYSPNCQAPVDIIEL